ncbi:KRFJ protein, partial [Edolisoma coerulescens]|nr:KRFJ protein [Edolisoma coerulescens]
MFSYRQSSSSRCLAPCGISCPQPLASTWNEPCVTSCGDSRAVIYPPPVVMTFPGPILSSCPQESIVGSSAPSGSGGFLGSGGSYGSYSYGRSYSSYGSSGYGFGSCRPC